MITANIDVLDGLVNGAVGTLKVYEHRQRLEDAEEDQEGEMLPKRLWLEFSGSTGTIARLRAKNAVREARGNGYAVESAWVPIEPRTLTRTVHRKAGIACKRTQFPVVQASAITVHKSQGGTYTEVVYEYAKTHPQKLVYVALSRCTDINNLYMTNASGDHRFYHRDENPDKSLADEMQRLENHKLVTVTRRYLDAFATEVDPASEFTLALLNTRSLRAHARGIERDPVLGKVDVLCLTETWNACSDMEGYATVACARSSERPARGVAMYRSPQK